MQNLFLIIARYGVFLLFLILQIINLNLIVRYNNAQREIFINSSNIISGWMMERTDNLVKYGRLAEEADSLAIENARLRAALDKVTYEPLNRPDTIKDTSYQQEYRYIPARVVNNSISFWDNKLTLNRGYSHGVKKGMGVINDKGIVGIIHHTSDRFSQAYSILHGQMRISATHKKSGQFGTLVWRNEDPLHITLRDVPKYADVIRGDTIVTNRFSSIFPDGLFIGTVDTFNIERGTNFYNIRVRLSHDLSKVNHVYVIDYLNKADQLAAEKIQENE
jgi:rod shape-determining protein MreC